MITPLLLSLLAADGSVTARAFSTPTLGGTVAPAALGAGTIAVYGELGAPELAVGYRQGFSALEVEARLSFNIFEVSSILQAGAKVSLLHEGPLQLAAGAMLGLKANTGATYFDLGNFSSWALRPAAIAVASYDLSEVLAAVARLDLPLAVSVNVHGLDFTPTIALGGEVLLGQGVSLLVMGRLGLDAREGPSGFSQARVAWGLQLGVGYRVF